MSRLEARCMNCGAIYRTKDMIATDCSNRGAKKAYMCADCARRNQAYTSGNNTDAEFGKVENGIKCGIELETTGSTLYARNMLFRFGFVPTNDSSLNDSYDSMHAEYQYGNSCEYVSGINHGMKRFTKQFIEIEKCLISNDIAIDDSCGTHFHVSFNDMRGDNGEAYMEMICNYFQSIFMEMQKVMQNNPSETEKFFGRYFTSFAPVMGECTRQRCGNHSDRYVWVNCTNHSNIEFRLNKFVSAKQYTELCMFEIWACKTIVNNFCLKYNDVSKRKENAKKCGHKLARKLEKIYVEMINSEF